MQLREMDEQVTYMQQLQEDDGPVVLINQPNVPLEDAERFVEIWAEDAAYSPRSKRTAPLSRGRCRRTTRLQEGRRPGYLRGLDVWRGRARQPVTVVPSRGGRNAVEGVFRA
jgi:hypothetical protein